MATRWGDRQARDADIRESARRLLRERGYVGLTMREVASGAGIALGSVYLYYPSKEDLFASLYIERLEQIIEELSTQLFEAATLGEAIVQFATGYMEVYRQFGKDVDLYALAASDRSDDNGSYDRFLATAARIFDTAWAGLVHHEPGLARLGERDRDACFQYLWLSLRGIAELVTGPRIELTALTPEELIRFASENVVWVIQTRFATTPTLL